MRALLCLLTLIFPLVAAISISLWIRPCDEIKVERRGGAEPFVSAIETIRNDSETLNLDRSWNECLKRNGSFVPETQTCLVAGEPCSPPDDPYRKGVWTHKYGTWECKKQDACVDGTWNGTTCGELPSVSFRAQAEQPRERTPRPVVVQSIDPAQIIDKDQLALSIKSKTATWLLGRVGGTVDLSQVRNALINVGDVESFRIILSNYYENGYTEEKQAYSYDYTEELKDETTDEIEIQALFPLYFYYTWFEIKYAGSEKQNLLASYSLWDINIGRPLPRRIRMFGRNWCQRLMFLYWNRRFFLQDRISVTNLLEKGYVSITFVIAFDRFLGFHENIDCWIDNMCKLFENAYIGWLENLWENYNISAFQRRIPEPGFVKVFGLVFLDIDEYRNYNGKYKDFPISYRSCEYFENNEKSDDSFFRKDSYWTYPFPADRHPFNLNGSDFRVILKWKPTQRDHEDRFRFGLAGRYKLEFFSNPGEEVQVYYNMPGTSQPKCYFSYRHSIYNLEQNVVTHELGHIGFKIDDFYDFSVLDSDALSNVVEDYDGYNSGGEGTFAIEEQDSVMGFKYGIGDLDHLIAAMSLIIRGFEFSNVHTFEANETTGKSMVRHFPDVFRTKIDDQPREIPTEKDWCDQDEICRCSDLNRVVRYFTSEGCE